MEQSSFRNYRQHLRKIYTERSQDIEKKPLDFSGCLWFNFGKGEKMVEGQPVSFEHPSEVWVRHTHDVMNVVLMKIYREATKFSCYHCMCTYFLNAWTWMYMYHAGTFYIILFIILYLS